MSDRTFNRFRLAARCWVMVLLFAAGGCLQIDTRVKLNPDGSATVTERVRASRRLIELSRMRSPDQPFDRHLSRESVLRRVSEMGKGAELTAHAIRDAEDGARECVSTISIPDLNNLRYVSPFLANADYPKHPALAFSLTPCYQSPHYGIWPGQMGVRVHPTARTTAAAATAPPPPAPAQKTPADIQIFRDLRPIARDMLQDFRVRLVFESYAPIGLARGYYYYRGQRAATREYDLIDFSSDHYDRFGGEFLDNEEIMLDLLLFRLAGGDLMGTIQQHPENLTVPVYHPSGIPPIVFSPSRALFDRHFVGKQLMFGKERGGPRIANFKEIGWGDEPPPAPAPTPAPAPAPASTPTPTVPKEGKS